MGRVKTFTNGGSLLPGDLNSIEDDYENSFATYKLIRFQRIYHANQVTAPGTWLMMPEGSGANALVNDVRSMVMYFDPARYPGGSRTGKLLLDVVLITNATAPATTITPGFYPLTWTGSTPTIGTVTSGSTVAFATPAASTPNQGNSGDFNMPGSAGWYGVALNFAAGTTAGSTFQVLAGLWTRAT